MGAGSGRDGNDCQEGDEMVMGRGEQLVSGRKIPTGEGVAVWLDRFRVRFPFFFFLYFSFKISLPFECVEKTSIYR